VELAEDENYFVSVQWIYLVMNKSVSVLDFMTNAKWRSMRLETVMSSPHFLIRFVSNLNTVNSSVTEYYLVCPLCRFYARGRTSLQAAARCWNSSVIAHA
jgi:hypothetical protein